MPQRASFRDPAGFVVRDGERIFRAVHGAAVPNLERLLASPWLRSHIEAGRIPATQWREKGPEGHWSTDVRWMEHERLSFPAYPHEISALQLFDAAELTLQLALDALEHGWVLKDASSWNILFNRGRPVFCDVLSFEPFAVSSTWLAYAQFQRCFTIPLLIFQSLGLPPKDWFLTHRDGVPPELARRLIVGVRAWRQPALEAITLPTMFASAGKVSATQTRSSRQLSPEAATHVVRTTLRRLGRHIERLRPSAVRSTWSDYEVNRDHYTSEELGQKAEFVAAALSDSSIHTVLDLGCNTGEYSRLAASAGKSVVAVDFDNESVQRLYALASRDKLDISPMAIDISRPPPALGWMNAEVPSFIDRARGRFDGLLALGVIHHLLVTERVPLHDVLEMLAKLATRLAVIEWIDTADPRFRDLAGPNLPLYGSLSRDAFESVLSQHFKVRAKLELKGGTRTLYECRSVL